MRPTQRPCKNSNRKRKRRSRLSGALSTDHAALNVPYLLMNALATIVASYGLLENSVAVIIGAMIIALLLGPITGIALALVDGDQTLLRRALLAEMAGALVVLTLSFVIGKIHGEMSLGSEIIGRTIAEHLGPDHCPGGRGGRGVCDSDAAPERGAGWGCHCDGAGSAALLVRHLPRARPVPRRGRGVSAVRHQPGRHSIGHIAGILAERLSPPGAFGPKIHPALVCAERPAADRRWRSFWGAALRRPSGRRPCARKRKNCFARTSAATARRP